MATLSLAFFGCRGCGGRRLVLGQRVEAEHAALHHRVRQRREERPTNASVWHVGMRESSDLVTRPRMRPRATRRFRAVCGTCRGETRDGLSSRWSGPTTAARTGSSTRYSRARCGRYAGTSTCGPSARGAACRPAGMRARAVVKPLVEQRACANRNGARHWREAHDLIGGAGMHHSQERARPVHGEERAQKGAART